MQTKRAFTLIELLAVIAIMVVLAALLMPALRLIRERGNQANCTSNLRQFATACAVFRADNPKHEAKWLSTLYPRYVNTTNLYLCRSDTAYGLEGGKPDWMKDMFPSEKMYPETRDCKSNPNGSAYRGRNTAIEACSYLYEFCNAECTWAGDLGATVDNSDHDNDGVVSWTEAKLYQMAEGDSWNNFNTYPASSFPMIRCFHHRLERKVNLADPITGQAVTPQGLTLNVAYSGASVFREGLQWEYQVTDE